MRQPSSLRRARGATLIYNGFQDTTVSITTHGPEFFADLHRRLDATIAYLSKVAPEDLEAGLDRAIVIEHRRGSMHSNVRQFLVAFAIPHFFYHVTTAYGILRNQGVPIGKQDFLAHAAYAIRKKGS